VGLIKDEMGRTWDIVEGVGAAFVEYFTSLFSSGLIGDYAPCIHLVERCVKKSMNTKLLRPFVDEEITVALFQIGPLKASGLDGLNTCFFHKNWSTMGDKVCCALLEILNFGVMPQGLHLTHVALIPKSKKPHVCYGV
jgi:hypothetical protein